MLALGEAHTQQTPYKFLREHLDELKHEHNLGTIGYEMDTLTNVFLWAYRDGRLPVPPELAERYLGTMQSYMAAGHDAGEGVAKSMYQRAALQLAACDAGITQVNFDARNTLGRIKNTQIRRTVDDMANIFRADPDLLWRARVDSHAMYEVCDRVLQSRDGLTEALEANGVSQAQFRDEVKVILVIWEARVLLKRYPDYLRDYENYQAVIEAGRKLEIGKDALSAAILTHSAAKGSNTITHSGLRHLTGPEDADPLMQLQGTFARQIEAMPLPMQTAVIASQWEKGWHLSPHILDIRDEYAQSNAERFELPPILIPKKDRIITATPVGEFPRSLDDWAFARMRDHHKPSPSPTHTVHGIEYIASMKAKLELPEMQEALSKLVPQR